MNEAKQKPAYGPVKLSKVANEKVGMMARMFGLEKKELLERAVDEFIERHHDEVEAQLEGARRLLLSGRLEDQVAYASRMVGVDMADIDRAYERHRESTKAVAAGA